MKGEDFTTALQTLGLDTQAAAKWLGVSVRAVQRYRVSGAPGPVERAVVTLLKNPAHKYDADTDKWTTVYDTSLALDWRE